MSMTSGLNDSEMITAGCILQSMGDNKMENEFSSDNFIGITGIECEVCGKLVSEDQAEEMMDTSDGSKIMMCPECASSHY